MAGNAGRTGARRGSWLGTAVALCAVALGTPAHAAPNAADTPWKLRTPMSETASREFWDVAATGAKDAWVVGRTTDGAAGPAPLIRHWNGATWKDVPPATTGGKPARLEEVAAAAPDDAWAAGSLDDNSSVVLQHWDGTKWRKVDHAPAPEGSLSFALDIAAFGPKSAWLTGFDWNPESGAEVSYLERWTGSRWQRVSLPAAPGGGTVRPSGITGTGPDDVWVTADTSTGGTAKPLLHHWNGSGWTVREVPVPAASPTGWAAGIPVATGRNAVSVVGSTNEDTPRATMAARWTGSRWQQLPAPPLGQINAAGADGAGRLWIGGWRAGDPHSALARWTGTEWATEELPADVTEHSEMSSVIGIAGVPGTKGVFAAGLAGCASDPVQCGMLVSRDLR